MKQPPELDIAMILAATVHDVKNSLGFISGQLESMTPEVQDSHPNVAQQLSRLQLESSRINNALTYMLGLYRADQDLLRPAIEEVLIQDVLEDAGARYDATLKHQNIELHLINDDPDLTWFLDPHLIDSLLTNIMTNSIRYSKSKIELSGEIIDDWLRIQVRDDGDGYPEQLLNCLDEDSSLQVKTSSTGLGIYFAAKIAALHTNGDKQGYIEFSNADTGGAIFNLWLP